MARPRSDLVQNLLARSQSGNHWGHQVQTFVSDAICSKDASSRTARWIRRGQRRDRAAARRRRTPQVLAQMRVARRVRAAARRRPRRAHRLRRGRRLARGARQGAVRRSLDGRAGRGAARVDAPLDLRRAQRGGGARGGARGAGRAAGPRAHVDGRVGRARRLHHGHVRRRAHRAAQGRGARVDRRRVGFAAAALRQSDGRARLGDAGRCDGVPRRPAARLRRGRLRGRARRRRRRAAHRAGPDRVGEAAGRYGRALTRSARDGEPRRARARAARALRRRLRVPARGAVRRRRSVPGARRGRGLDRGFRLSLSLSECLRGSA